MENNDLLDTWKEEDYEHLRMEVDEHPECVTCRNMLETGDRFGPTHEPSGRCRSGRKPHCTCAACF